MTIAIPDRTANAFMWRSYAAAWLAYIAFLTLALQLDRIVKGHFDLLDAAQIAGATLPSALELALVWPLTGYLERSGCRPGITAAVHLAAALSFSAVSLALMVLVFGPVNKPFAWFVWPFLYTAMMYGVVAGIFQMVRARQTAHRQTVAMHQAQSLLIASELSALRGKLNPHFLFNTLHSIIALTRKDSTAAEAALFQFSDMLRYILDTEKSGHDRVTLDDELRFVRDYLDLEALRLGRRLTVEWELDASAGFYSVPALSLQPLVENSIKHAFNPHSRPGTLLIRTRLDGDRLTMTVRDDGPGADLAAIGASSGLGIRTVGRRLELDYGARAAFRIDTAPGAGFGASISIPLEPAPGPA